MTAWACQQPHMCAQAVVIMIIKPVCRDCVAILVLTVAQAATRSAEANANALSYEIMWRYAQTQLSCGLSVIVDCPLAREELYHKGAALAAEACTQPSCTLLE